MKKYIAIIIKLVKLNFQKDMIYRLNALFTFISSTIYTITFVLGLWYVFKDIETIKGVTYREIFLLIMLGQLWWYFNVIFVRENFQHIIKSINNGMLDIYLLKPMNFRALIPFLQFDMRHIFPMIICIFLIVLNVNFENVSWWDILLAWMYFINSVVMAFSWTSIFASLNMSGKRNMAIFDITSELPPIMQIPLVFFPHILRIFFIYVIPANLLITPVYMLLSKNSNCYILLASALMGIFYFLLSELMWKSSLKKYTSAS